MKEEEKEKLHLEQQQHYDVYFTKKKKSAKFITLLLQGWLIVEWEREIMDETLCEFLWYWSNTFFLPSKLKKEIFYCFFSALPPFWV